MIILPLKLKKKLDNSYNIYIGNNIFDKIILDFITKLKPSKFCIITDTNIFEIYKIYLQNIFEEKNILTIKAGESSKNFETIKYLATELSKLRFDRKSLIISFGGGVVGDISGFLSSIFLRGINYIQVPTSLLSCVDSSIGGKTGIDTDFGKNLIGTFYQPKAVIIDTNFLDTLPENEYLNGLVEIIKAALIKDKNFFKFIYDNKDLILKKQNSTINNIIFKSCKIKKEIVEKDEKESGLRQVLNFGHTIGHAIEYASSYTIPHGFAVALGILIESYISFKKGHLKEKDFILIKDLINYFNLNKYKENVIKLDKNKIIDGLYQDKKNLKGNINIVLLKEIGKVLNYKYQYSFKVDLKDILEAFEIINT